MKYRPEYDLKVIGKNLKRLRQTKGLSVDEVRKYLRLGTTQAIYKYESGKGYPQTDTMFALMELYEADLYDIIGEHTEKDKAWDNKNSKNFIFSIRNRLDYVVSDHIIEFKDANMWYKKKQFKRMREYIELLEKYHRAG